MKTKIKEVQDYFIQKLMSGDFEVINRSEHTFEILVDDEYLFNIWMTNEPLSRRCYDGYYNFMHLPFTGIQSKKLHSVMKKDYEYWKDGQHREERKRKYEELKAEFEGKLVK